MTPTEAREKINLILELTLDDYLQEGTFNKDKLMLILNGLEYIIPKRTRTSVEDDVDIPDLDY